MGTGIFYFLGFAAAAMVLLLLVQRAAARLLDGGGDLKRNPARGIAESGEILGAFLVAGAVAHGSVHGEDFGRDVLNMLAFGLAGGILLEAAGRLGVRIVLRSRLASEIARGNPAAGVAAAGHAIATGTIVASCIYGDDLGAIGVSLLFFLVAQATLHGLVALFRALTAYDDTEEILDENLAAALSYAGVTVALGLLIGHAADGEFTTFGESLKDYGVALLLGLALYPVRQVLVQGLILRSAPTLRGGRLDRAISEERAIGMGALEAATYVATALMVGAVA
jgi:uncharacterized membrane protein YjfL (UPF0719 family)